MSCVVVQSGRGNAEVAMSNKRHNRPRGRQAMALGAEEGAAEGEEASLSHSCSNSHRLHANKVGG